MSLNKLLTILKLFTEMLRKYGFRVKEFLLYDISKLLSIWKQRFV